MSEKQEKIQDYSQFQSDSMEVEDKEVNIDFQMGKSPFKKTEILPNLPLEAIPGDTENYTEESEPTSYPELDFRNLMNDSNLEPEIPNTTYISHSIANHAATFIPQIPGFILRRLAEEGVEEDRKPRVLDPFNGQGTTGIEALTQGFDYTGVEINPLSVLMSEIATTPISPEIKDSILELANDEIEDDEYDLESYNIEFPGRTDKTHWFEDEVIEDIKRIRAFIYETDLERLDSTLGGTVTKDSIRKILILSFVRTVFDVSNADPGVSKAFKSKKMRRKIKEGEHPPDGIDSYKANLKSLTEELVELWVEVIQKPDNSYNNLPEINIEHSDSRESVVDSENRADVVITSPPYINAINYYRGSKLRLFWSADMLSDYYDFDSTKLKREFVGSNSVRMDKPDDEFPPQIENIWSGSKDSFGETRLTRLDNIIEDIYELDQSNSKKKSYVTWKFFAEDMPLVLEKTYKNLKSGGYVFFVVGENTIGSQLIPTHKFIEDISSSLGKIESTSLSRDKSFRVVASAFDRITNRGLFKQRNHNSGVIECEWIVMLQKE